MNKLNLLVLYHQLHHKYVYCESWMEPHTGKKLILHIMPKQDLRMDLHP